MRPMTKAHRRGAGHRYGTPPEPHLKSASHTPPPESAERWKLGKNAPFFGPRTLALPTRDVKIRYVARFGLRVLFHFVQRPRQK